MKRSANFCFILLFFPLLYTACPLGRYGSDCRFICGQCGGSSLCDVQTGLCPSGCRGGWKSRYCNVSYPLLKDPPSLRNRSGDSVTIAWKKWTSKVDIGEGSPMQYVVQTKERHIKDWSTIKNLEADEWSEKNDGFEVDIHGLREDSDHLIRVVVVDKSREIQWNGIPQLKIDKKLNRRDLEENAKKNETQKEVPQAKGPKNRWKEWFIGFGALIAAAFIVAVIIVVVVECRRRKVQKEKKKMIKEQNADWEMVEQGAENPGYVTLRTDRSSRSNQRACTLVHQGRWKEAVPGLRATAQHEPQSWYTEWAGSRIYDAGSRIYDAGSRIYDTPQSPTDIKIQHQLYHEK